MLTNDYNVITTLAVLAVASTIIFRLVHVGDFILASRQGPALPGTISKLNGIPYALIFFEGALWLRYGISDDLLSVYVAESFTFLCGIMFTVAWSVSLTWKTDRLQVILVLVIMAVATAIVIVLMGVAYFAIYNDFSLQTHIFGIAGVIGSAIWNTYPFLSWCIKQEPDAISLLTSLTLFINGILWLFYSLTIDNLYLIITASIRLVSGFTQIIVSLAFEAHLYNIPLYIGMNQESEALTIPRREPTIPL